MKRWAFLLGCAITAGTFAGLFVQLSQVRSVATMVMAVFGFMTGFLVNAKMRTAQALEAGSLSLDQLVELSKALRDQQRNWQNLYRFFLAVIFYMFVLMLTPDKWPTPAWLSQWTPDLSWFGVALAAGLVTLALLRSLSIVEGVEALQELRTNLILSAVAAKEQEARSKGALTYAPGGTNPNYGRRIAGG